MPRKVRTHIPTDAPRDPALAPKHLTKQEFGKRLYKLMLSRGWHQSELARQSGLPRDSISVYVRGKSLPTPTSVAALSRALGVGAEELLPNHLEGAIDEDQPSLEIRVSTNSSDVAWIRLNRAVSVKTALKIAELLENDNVLKRDVSDRS
ncbi:MAG: helix-turn-helix domain-containing protein [Aquidulcibacter sp.]